MTRIDPGARTSVAERAFAVAYDPLMAMAERGGLGRIRRRLIAPLNGRVVEVGAGTGTGANIALYPASVELTVCEPALSMRQHLERLTPTHAVTAIGPRRRRRRWPAWPA
jgi:hypothetical protein